MVTYYNQSDMEQYSVWVAQKLFPLPDNWAVSVKCEQFSMKIEKQLQLWHGSFDLGIRTDKKREIVNELFKLINQYESDINSNTEKKHVRWFGRVKDDNNKFRSGSVSFLNDNKMLTPDGYKMEFITMNQFVLHFIGLRIDGLCIKTWIDNIKGIVNG